MSDIEIIGFIISIVSIGYLYIKSLSLPRQDRADSKEVFSQKSPRKSPELPREMPGSTPKLKQSRSSPIKVATKYEKFSAAKQLKTAPDQIFGEERKLIPSSRAQKAVNQLSSLSSLVVYHEILSKPKSLRNE